MITINVTYAKGVGEKFGGGGVGEVQHCDDAPGLQGKDEEDLAR